MRLEAREQNLLKLLSQPPLYSPRRSSSRLSSRLWGDSRERPIPLLSSVAQRRSRQSSAGLFSRKSLAPTFLNHSKKKAMRASRPCFLRETTRANPPPSPRDPLVEQNRVMTATLVMKRTCAFCSGRRFSRFRRVGTVRNHRRFLSFRRSSSSRWSVRAIPVFGNSDLGIFTKSARRGVLQFGLAGDSLQGYKEALGVENGVSKWRSGGR